MTHSNGTRQTLTGFMAHSTNNRMELTAATVALNALVHDDAPAVLFLDSEYVVKGATLWRSKWAARGWRNAKGEPVANLDLWQRLFNVLDRRPDVRLEWVRGHAGNELNEAVDKLARAEAERARLSGDECGMSVDGEPLFTRPRAIEYRNVE